MWKLESSLIFVPDPAEAACRFIVMVFLILSLLGQNDQKRKE
jgi:hypothetical protein